MNRFYLAGLIMVITVCTAVLITARYQSGYSDTLEESLQQAAELDRRLARMEDLYAIENLQRTYGFFIDKGLWRETADLFTADGRLEAGDHGVFIGQERILAYLQSLGPAGPQYGRLMDQMQLQPIITLSDDGNSARGRWRLLAMGGVDRPDRHPAHAPPGADPDQPYGYLGTGIYENRYVKEQGVWKIKSLHFFTRVYTRDTDGWARTILPAALPQSDLEPDGPPSVEYEPYPGTYLPPSHYRHPVTGD